MKTREMILSLMPILLGDQHDGYSEGQRRYQAAGQDAEEQQAAPAELQAAPSG